MVKKNFGLKEILLPKFGVRRKFSLQKFFCLKHFFGQTNFIGGPIRFLVLKKFRSRKNLVQKSVGPKNFFGPQNFGSKNIIGMKKILFGN